MADNRQRYYQMLGQLVRETPTFSDQGPLSSEQQAWLGRACALVRKVSPSPSDWVAVDNRAQRVLTPPRAEDVQHICAVLYRALATLEIDIEPASQGAFIPAGNAFDALAAISKVFETAKLDLLIIDPYMDEKALTIFAVLAAESTTIKLLADKAFVKPGLRPAAMSWASQYGTRRPLDARIAPEKSLHDRLIIVDGKTVYTLTQSLNAFAARSPASILRVDPETGALKVAAYEAIWTAANAL